MPIEQISDTALLTAFARAEESERKDALFCDRSARVLAGDRGAALASESRAFATIANAVACRTAVIDDLLLRILRRAGVDVVLNLGAGLDARPWRLDLPSDLRWLDVDLPQVLDYKRKRIGHDKPRCRYETYPADLSVPEGLSRAIARGICGNQVLVITEGLLVYLSEAEVGQLAGQLQSQPSIEWWITDLAGPRALAMMANSWGTLLRGARFQFGPTNVAAFFGGHGWKESEFRSSQEEAQRLGRVPKSGVLKRLALGLVAGIFKAELRRLSGVAVLQRL